MNGRSIAELFRRLTAPLMRSRAGQERHLVRVLETAHIATWELEIGTMQVRWSGEFGRVTGLDGTEAPAEQLLKSIHEEDRWRAAYTFKRAIKRGSSHNIELRIMTRDGSVRCVRCAGEVVFGSGGLSGKIVGVLFQVADGRLMAESNRMQSRLIALNRMSRDLCMALSREQLVRRAVYALRNDLGYPGALIAVRNQFVRSSREPEQVTQPPEGSHRVPVQVGRRRIGTIIVPADRWSSIDQELLEMFASHIAVAIQNIQLFEKMQNVASKDPLTGVLNRRQVLQLAHRQVLHHCGDNGSMCVIAFDIDHFKQINDTYGHPTGDEVLRLVARRAKECIRQTDLLARYGGDEFVIFLPNTGLDCAQEIAERLRSTVQHSILIAQERSISFTVSVGIAFSTGRFGLFALVDQADKALYAAKDSGRNYVFSAATRS